MIRVLSRSPAETKALGAAIGKKIKAGSVIALTGPLGSGKTTFAQGLARGLSLRGRIKSPTFTLINHLRSRDKKRDFFHLDLYRLKGHRDLPTLGLPELLAEKRAVVAIEWPEVARRLLPAQTILISFSHGKKVNERIICIEKS